MDKAKETESYKVERGGGSSREVRRGEVEAMCVPPRFASIFHSREGALNDGRHELLPLLQTLLNLVSQLIPTPASTFSCIIVYHLCDRVTAKSFIQNRTEQHSQQLSRSLKSGRVRIVAMKEGVQRARQSISFSIQRALSVFFSLTH